MAWTAPRDWTAGETVTEAIQDTHIKDNLDWLYDNLPIRFSIFHGDALVTAGNSMVQTIAATQAYNQSWAQTAAADSDSFTYSFVLGAGTYTIYFLGRTTTTSGKIDWDIDGTAITVGQDWYSGAGVVNVEQSVAAVTVGATDGGRHTMTGTVNGKNVASGGYTIALTKVWAEPAAD